MLQSWENHCCRRASAFLFFTFFYSCYAFVPAARGPLCGVEIHPTPTHQPRTRRSLNQQGGIRTITLAPTFVVPWSREQRSQLTLSSPLRAGQEENSGIGAVDEDPFRPERASVAPVVINALVKVLFQEVGAEAAAALSTEQRSASVEWELTEDEKRAVKDRVCGVANTVTELRFMLATAVSRSPSIAKYGMLSDYGMGDDLDGNPLAQMNHAECLLALYMLHKEEDSSRGGEAPRPPPVIDFLDADRLEVLRGTTARLQ